MYRTQGHPSNTHRHPRRRCRMAVIGLLLALSCGSPALTVAQDLMTKASLPDLVAEAESIVVADLVDARARRNARGNLIVTDLHFRTDQVLLGMLPRSGFVLTQGGGTLAGETHEISDTPDLVVGNRYLLFVRPGRGEMFAPFVGGAQGAYLLSSDGTATSLAGTQAPVAYGRLIEQVDALIAERGAAPPRAARSGNVPAGTYPAKVYQPLALTPPVGGRAPATSDVAVVTPGAVTDDARMSGGTRAGVPMIASPDPAPDYRYEHRITPPAVFNAFPHDWTPWHPEEEYQMANWNAYGGSVFHVFTTPTGNWAWENDRFDLAGWPDNATMIDQFGEGWGANTLAITWSRWFGDGPIVESDIALNPAFCWTLDERAATNAADSCWGFRQTMKHELGHAWGLKHPWETQDVWWDSIMNYSPKNYRYPRLFADETNAVRAAFAGPAIHDALLSLYTTASGGSQSALYTPTQPSTLSLTHGSDLSAWIGNPFKIENLGSDDIVAPTVQFFLSQQRLDWNAGYAYLGSAVYSNVGVFVTYSNWLPWLPIPATTPTGNYTFAAYLPDTDADMGSNSAWADEGVMIHVDNNPATLVPDTSWQVSEFGYLGPAGRWTFTLVAEEATTYYFSLCPGSGGSADFDTVLSISYAGSIVAQNDDACGLLSDIAWTAPYAGVFTITVGSYLDGEQGTFLLGYRRDISDVLFADGFDG